MLAGLPKAPSAYNPINNPKRARTRQLYIIERMQENGFITAEQAVPPRKSNWCCGATATSRHCTPSIWPRWCARWSTSNTAPRPTTRGLTVYTTLNANAQRAAYAALRRGVLDYERRQHYRGPEKFIALPSDPKARADAIDEVIASHPDSGEPARPPSCSKPARARWSWCGRRRAHHHHGRRALPVQSGLSDKAPPNLRLVPGAVVRVVKSERGWDLTQMPEVEVGLRRARPATGTSRPQSAASTSRRTSSTM